MKNYKWTRKIMLYIEIEKIYTVKTAIVSYKINSLIWKNCIPTAIMITKKLDL